MSDEQTLTGDPGSPEAMPADPAQAIRAEIHREYAGKLALAELRAQAAKDEITLPDGFTDFLDMSKLLDTDGQPVEDVINQVLNPFRAKFAELQGAGYHRGTTPNRPAPSLDARHR
ncbi:hypothetical protein OG401_10265 [Kitasatospora purpeofusca]|uniref:hypothetical protein n=1 Tax=Kitasatospora purpeofusca TaxID=67352 RepID=UPI002253C697|nr:hypothetical protein [Kitasatospora purpeofusca]MCX4684688.1 hypothetical protein [Kitasatospora purpeofusca]